MKKRTEKKMKQASIKTVYTLNWPQFFHWKGI